jgi:hypothetical protein
LDRGFRATTVDRIRSTGHVTGGLANGRGERLAGFNGHRCGRDVLGKGLLLAGECSEASQ